MNGLRWNQNQINLGRQSLTIAKIRNSISGLCRIIGWRDTPNESLNFPDDFELYEFLKWIEEQYPEATDWIIGTIDGTDACWYTFDPALGYDGFQTIIDEYFEGVGSD